MERVISTSPQAPQDVLVDVPATEPDVVVESVATARAAAREWISGSPGERSGALTRLADSVAAAAEELAELITREVGKPISEARGEVARSQAILRYYAQVIYDGEGELFPTDQPGITMVRRVPLGVVGLITPWNFPLAIPLWKLAPAVAYGNGVVLKPSPFATGCAIRLAELMGKALPAGLVHVLPGNAATGAALLSVVDGLSFTGSSQVGRLLVREAAVGGVAMQAEMGGLNASIVLADADFESAAESIVGAAMGYAGQKCTATQRIIVVGDSSEFADALVAATEALHVGDPADPQTVVGPVISDAARSAVLDAVESSGGRVLAGGGAPDEPGWFVAPALISDAEASSRVATAEVFGPIATLARVDSNDAAIAAVNSADYGLVTSVYGRDLRQALSVAESVDTGMVRINRPTSGVDFWTPFGGAKESSYGPREQGRAAREFYTSTRTVSIGLA